MLSPTSVLLPERNNFYLGAYEKTIEALTTQQLPGFEPRLLLLKCYLAQKNYSQILSSTNGEKAPELVAINLLATYLSTGTDISGKMKDLVASIDPSSGLGSGSGVPVLAATLYYNMGNLEDALKLLATLPKDLECAAMIVQIYLKMDRVDLAKKELTAIRSWADDATLAQLIEAWVDTYSGDTKKYQDAYYIFEELASSKVATSSLLNGQAVCRMQAGRFDDAEAVLMESVQKDSRDPETLINLIVCATSTGRDTTKFYTALREAAPNHAFLRDLASKENQFDDLALKYQ